ncbi:ras-GEF domain-containing family member 1B isoform X2 [Hermetia illucens]|uniref:ras-GEF domain-containing family member 1B isoform X2 n=1 Tax=Hermetia illucens TaxID=343691 RepID=UPI0018CC5854|nr:ras-GEF domain-containing family member 1B isoform X2 [Hermetia illucens]
MAMYYYASKISAIACGTRCRQSVLQKSRGQRDRDKHEEFLKQKEFNDKVEISFNPKVSDPIKSNSAENGGNGSTNNSGGAENCPYVSIGDIDFQNSELEVDPSGIVYAADGITIASGPLESLVDLLMPNTTNHLDEGFVYSFLLSSRLFIRPHEILGKLLSSVPEEEPLDRLVYLLSEWTRKFPYDFRDENIMTHVKHIVSRCSNTRLEEVVSVMLSALLKRLTDLEQHEKYLRAGQQNSSDDGKTDSIECSSPSEFAQLLCRVEKKLAKHVGPEEFLQCSSTILVDKQIKKSDLPQFPSSGPPGCQDAKKTCNLEAYLEWSAKLRRFVSNEILQCSDIQNRSKMVELWSGTAQYCLAVGNYNSATAILEALESPSIIRLKETWGHLAGTAEQLNCMLKHAEGSGDLWNKQLISPCTRRGSLISTSSKQKPNDWVVIPVFSDIVKLALEAREDCLIRLPNGDLNITAFNRLAAIVKAYANHMADVKLPLSEAGEYEDILRYLQKTTFLSDSE